MGTVETPQHTVHNATFATLEVGVSSPIPVATRVIHVEVQAGLRLGCLVLSPSLAVTVPLVSWERPCEKAMERMLWCAQGLHVLLRVMPCWPLPAGVSPGQASGHAPGLVPALPACSCRTYHPASHRVPRLQAWDLGSTARRTSSLGRQHWERDHGFLGCPRELVATAGTVSLATRWVPGSVPRCQAGQAAGSMHGTHAGARLRGPC